MTLIAVSVLIIAGLVLGHLWLFSNFKGKLGSKTDLLVLYHIVYALDQYYHEVLHLFPNWKHLQSKQCYSPKSL